MVNQGRRGSFFLSGLPKQAPIGTEESKSGPDRCPEQMEPRYQIIDLAINEAKDEGKVENDFIH